MAALSAQLEAQHSLLQPIHELLHWLGEAALSCVAGLVLGYLGARLLRRQQHHYSWAAPALASAPVLHGPAGGRAAWSLTLAAAYALHRGRRWHRQDLDAGEDLARAAKERRTPVAVAALAARQLALHRRRHAPSSAARTPHMLLLGHDERRRRVLVPLGSASGGTHTLVVGATGSGKTVTQTRIAIAAIERGMGVVVLDPKGDAGLRGQLAHAAARAERRMLEWTPDGELIYNPFAHGTDTEVADQALAGERFTEPHYLRQAQRYLAHAVRALRASGEEVSLGGIVRCLDPVALELLARELPLAHAGPVHGYVGSLSPRQQSELAGVRDRLAILTESDVGRWLDPGTPGVERFELLGALRAGSVIYFSLQSDRRPLLSQMLAAAIVQDLQTVVAASQTHPLQALVMVDEFSALAVEQVVGLFGRARSAGVSLLLGTQEISDLRPPGRERLLEQVMGNVTLLIAHRQVVPRSAQLIAELAGSVGAWKLSCSSDGRTTRTRTRRSLLEPDRIAHLEQGWAAVIALGAGGQARTTRVLADGGVR